MAGRGLDESPQGRRWRDLLVGRGHRSNRRLSHRRMAHRDLRCPTHTRGGVDVAGQAAVVPSAGTAGLGRGRLVGGDGRPRSRWKHGRHHGALNHRRSLRNRLAGCLERATPQPPTTSPTIARTSSEVGRLRLVRCTNQASRDCGSNDANFVGRHRRLLTRSCYGLVSAWLHVLTFVLDGAVRSH